MAHLAWAKIVLTPAKALLYCPSLKASLSLLHFPVGRDFLRKLHSSFKFVFPVLVANL
jgi:hypothetical protein